MQIRLTKALFKVIFTLALSFNSYAGLGPASSQYCKAQLSKAGLPQSIHVHEYGVNRCYYNVFNIIKSIVDDPNFDMSKLKVLYVSHLDGFSVHAILVYDNFIIDPSQTPDNPNEAMLIPREEYFVHVPAMYISQVRVIPASDYLAEFEEKTPAYYIEGMNVDSRNTIRTNYTRSANQRYPLQLLTDYFQKEHVEPVYH